MLEWNAASWTAGSTATHYFELDSSNPGPDISISITGSTDDFVLSTPNDTTYLTGEFGASQESLRLAIDFDSRSETVVITVNFHYAQGVTGVNFMLFDIDQADDDFQDYITGIYGQYNGGTPKGPTSITDSSGNTDGGSGTNRWIRGDEPVDDNESSGDGNANNGNATINYGTNIINRFSFTYGNYPDAPSSPGDQWIGLYDINFTPRPRLPETGTTVAAGLVCGLGVFFTRRRLRAKATST